MFALSLGRRIPFRSAVLSVAAHAFLAAAWLAGVKAQPVRVFSLPGTASGSRIELTYLPGRPAVHALASPSKIKPRMASAALAPAKIAPAPPVAMPDAETGSDSWGSGSIQIALTTFSPSPAPDLSSLPRGVQGDVVVDVTIDPSGKVADLAVLHSLGYGIESSVIGTLKTWTFHPATKDGSPIASVQELHFHFGPV